MAPRAKPVPMDRVKPVFLRGGFIHLHYVEQRIKTKEVNGEHEKRYEWVVRERQHADICGTNRCVFIRMDINQELVEGVCDHKYGMPDKPVFKCEKCGLFAEADLNIRQVKKNVL